VLVNAASQSASLTLNPSSTFVNEGTSTTLTAVLRDALGNIVTGATITWSSSDNQVASVSTTGVVTGVHAGSAVITASGNGLTATSSVTVSVPGQYAAPDLASTNLEAGSSSPFTDTNGSSTGNSYVTLMNDPTGQFGGKVARFRFNRTSTAASVDVNRALSFTHPTGVGLGQTVFMRGHVLIPTPASNMSKAMRKLIYVQRQPNDASFAVIKANGNTLKAEITGNRVFSGGAFPYDRKVSIEIQITANSAIGVADGIFRIWKDGVLVVDRSDVLWLTSTSKFKEIKFGQQTQHELHDATILFDEYRYWDNLAVSTRRIGP
jgi:hypothetical protein